jgi:UDP-N-acetylglucosamine--N-acetylmuramyl-(pentapeptide) pyrophosphoryl-undecaprenol N-acetylglucosamine transferase
VVASRATAHALGLVARLAPSAVLSVGGYAAGPVSLAAAARGVPVTVFEPNSTVGLTNRLLAPFTRRAYLAWQSVAPRFRRAAVRMTGVPLRGGFTPRPYAAKGTARVLVMGGSQGAAALNERMPAAMARVLREVPTLDVLHQAGRDRDEDVRAAYGRESVERVSVVPFLDDVAREIAGADVVVARAGAVTVAEIAAVGRAALLVPFPFAADDHQAKNAESLAAAGGAVAVRQEAADSVRIALELSRLLRDDAARTAMADAARAHGRPGAALDVATDLLQLAGIPLRGSSLGNGARGTNGPRTRRSEAN